LNSLRAATSKDKITAGPKSAEVPKIEQTSSDKRPVEKKIDPKDKSKDVKDVKPSSVPASKRPTHRRVASEAISAKDLVKKTIPTVPAITTDTSHVAKDKKDKDKKGKDKKNKPKSTGSLPKKRSHDSGELSARSETSATSSEQSESALVERPAPVEKPVLGESPGPSLKTLHSEPAMSQPHEQVTSRTSAPELLKTSDDGAQAVELIKRIGKGATATVWQGLLNGQPVALKQVHLGVRAHD
jgi:hypothetical protein